MVDMIKWKKISLYYLSWLKSLISFPLCLIMNQSHLHSENIGFSLSTYRLERIRSFDNAPNHLLDHTLRPRCTIYGHSMCLTSALALCCVVEFLNVLSDGFLPMRNTFYPSCQLIFSKFVPRQDQNVLLHKRVLRNDQLWPYKNQEM